MNQSALKADTLPDRIPCLLAPVSNNNLMLPITAVAEVINTVTMPESGNDKTPLYGWINWRDQRIPLISMEAAMGGGRPYLRLENRMAILNAIGDASSLGFYAILLQGLPTPVQANSEILRGEASTAKLALLDVQIGEEKALVPDLLAVEKIVAGFGSR